MNTLCSQDWLHILYFYRIGASFLHRSVLKIFLSSSLLPFYILILLVLKSRMFFCFAVVLCSVKRETATEISIKFASFSLAFPIFLIKISFLRFDILYMIFSCSTVLYEAHIKYCQHASGVFTCCTHKRCKRFFESHYSFEAFTRVLFPKFHIFIYSHKHEKTEYV